MAADIKRHCGKSFKSLLPYLFPLSFLLFLFVASPKEAYIYYEGDIDNGTFSVVADIQLEVNIDDSGQVRFLRRDNGEILAEGTDGSASFPFADGTATLSASEGLELTLTSSDGKPLKYELVFNSNPRSEGARGYIEFSNLSSNTQILLQAKSGQAIHMRGSREEMSATGYNVYGCDAIRLDAASIRNLEDLSGGRSISEQIDAFSFHNPKRNTIEVTITGETEFREIGRGVLAGAAKPGQLTLTIKDTSQSPVCIELWGAVEQLTLSDCFLFPDCVQWFFENRTEIIMAFISAFFASFLFPILKNGKKQEVEN